MAWCEKCGAVYNNAKFCIKCGVPLKEDGESDLVYFFDNLGQKRVVMCPQCRSTKITINVSTYATPTYTTVVPADVKTRYTLNLNPLRPFTLVNKKETVKRSEQYVVHGGEERTVRKYICGSCGNVF